MRTSLTVFALGLSVLAQPLAAQKPVPAVEYPAYQGPKKTIAVSKFDASGGFVSQYGGWDIGGGLAAMLASELQRTNRFIVVERADLDTLLREKQMVLSDVASGGSGKPLLAAQTFVRGSVTEFDESEKGGGLSLGFNLAGGKAGAGSRQKTGHIAIDLRLIDAASGAVVASRRVEKTIKSNSVALDASARGVSFGGDQFEQTSLGRASRAAIQEAVAHIVRAMDSVPWQGLIAQTDGERIFVNAGHNANLAPGMRLRASRVVNAIKDPATGEMLGSEKRTVGEFVITDVQDRYSVGKAASGMLPDTGDVVEIIPR